MEQGLNLQPVIDWITAIPFEEWPQQSRLEDGLIRPAMVTDLAWHNFGKITDPIVSQVMADNNSGPSVTFGNRMLSVVMPGHSIPSHRDDPSENWLMRYHIPLMSNTKAWFLTCSGRIRMHVGSVYMVDVRNPHGISNEGSSPRIHFMFDIFQ